MPTVIFVTEQYVAYMKSSNQAPSDHSGSKAGFSDTGSLLDRDQRPVPRKTELAAMVAKA